MKWLLLPLALWPWSAFAQSCDTPAQGVEQQSYNQDAKREDAGRETGEWVRSGLLLFYQPMPPPPVIDQQTVAMQICEGCAAGRIRYAPSAAMREGLPATQWADDIRRLASASAVAADYETASSYLDQALTHASDPLQRQVLENLKIETALQFQRSEIALSLLAAYGRPNDLPGPLLSDRLFWSVFPFFDTADTDEWRSNILPILERAFEADRSSYQIRVWRVIGWLMADMWEEHRDCGYAVSLFSARVLDSTAEAACPLMLGHLSHTLDRVFEMRAGERPGTELETWHTFAVALLSTLARNTVLRDQLISNLRQAGPRAACSDRMAQAMAELREVLK